MRPNDRTPCAHGSDKKVTGALVRSGWRRCAKLLPRRRLVCWREVSPRIRIERWKQDSRRGNIWVRPKCQCWHSTWLSLEIRCSYNCAKNCIQRTMVCFIKLTWNLIFSCPDAVWGQLHVREHPFNLLDPTFGHCPNSYWTPPPALNGALWGTSFWAIFYHFEGLDSSSLNKL